MNCPIHNDALDLIEAAALYSGDSSASVEDAGLAYYLCCGGREYWEIRTISDGTHILSELRIDRVILFPKSS
mgnify:CR=1 FL=1